MSFLPLLLENKCSSKHLFQNLLLEIMDYFAFEITLICLSHQQLIPQLFEVDAVSIDYIKFELIF